MFEEKEGNKSLIYANLTYKIIGMAYKVYNMIGPGFQEKYYQRALKNVFKKEGLSFLEQVRVDFVLNGENIGKYYIDFVIDDKVVLELKSKNFFSRKDVKQVLGYLKKSGLEVGLLIAFSISAPAFSSMAVSPSLNAISVIFSYSER